MIYKRRQKSATLISHFIIERSNRTRESEWSIKEWHLSLTTACIALMYVFIPNEWWQDKTLSHQGLTHQSLLRPISPSLDKSQIIDTLKSLNSFRDMASDILYSWCWWPLQVKEENKIKEHKYLKKNHIMNAHRQVIRQTLRNTTRPHYYMYGSSQRQNCKTVYFIRTQAVYCIYNTTHRKSGKSSV